jgi:pimeloyl-ACP methyl ester carboxylesterase
VLDGVYPVDLDVDAGVAYSADRALEELAAACAADEECAGWAPDVVTLVEDLMVTLDRDPITVDTDDGPVLLDGGRLAEFVFVVLYSEQRMRFLPGALAGIAAGDDDAARWLARNGTASIVSSQGINDEGTYWAVQCHDRLPFTDGPPDDAAPFPAAIASALLADSCDPWDRPGATTADPVVSDLPTLLLSGRFDPITPSSYAADAAAHLGAPTLIEQDGRGHGIWPGGDDCITAIVAAFVADPDGEVDTRCAAAGVPVDWARP